MKKTFSTWIVLLGLWIILAGFSPMDWLIGAIASFAVSFLISRMVPYEFSFKSIIGIFKFIILYVPLFVYELIKANIQLAKIVLTPSLPIHPGFVKIKTGIKSDVGKLTLANSITLTPGTLSLDVNEDEIFIHWVDVKGEDQEQQQKAICGSFENMLRGIFK